MVTWAFGRQGSTWSCNGHTAPTARIKSGGSYRGCGCGRKPSKRCLHLAATTASRFGFHVLKNEHDQTSIVHDVGTSQLRIERGAFVGDIQSADVDTTDDTLTWHIFVDRSSVEVFTQDDEVVMTALTFPVSPPATGLSLFSEGGDVALASLDVHLLDSAWGDFPDFSSNLSGWTYPTTA